jgi:hypothetical protein
LEPQILSNTVAYEQNFHARKVLKYTYRKTESNPKEYKLKKTKSLMTAMHFQLNLLMQLKNNITVINEL